MLGIFGGTFDPVHFGHIKSALALLKHFDFDRIHLIPCQQSPLKGRVYASAKHRLEMLSLVTNSNARLVADDRELVRHGISYTIDTLKDLYEENNHRQALVLIIGMDVFLEFCKWHKHDEVLSFCHIIILQRPGYRLPVHGCEKRLYDMYASNDIMDLQARANGHMYLSEEASIDISSTSIRQSIAAGIQPKYLLPGNVWNYICRNNLYHKICI